MIKATSFVKTETYRGPTRKPISAPAIDAVIGPPGSEHFSVGDVFRPVPGFELFYNGLDMPGLVLGVRFFGSFRCI